MLKSVRPTDIFTVRFVVDLLAAFPDLCVQTHGAKTSFKHIFSSAHEGLPL